MHISSTWAYRTLVKHAIGFTTFNLVHGVEVVIPIESKVPLFKLSVESPP